MTSLAEGKLVLPVWADDDVIKPIVDDNGRIKITLGEATVTIDVNIESTDITLPVEEQSPLTTIQAQSYGWVTGDWHKNPILRGYSSVARSYLTATSSGAGWIRAETGACPSDYIRVVEGFTMQHNGAAAQPMVAGVWNTTIYCGVRAYVNCTPSMYYGEGLSVTMAEGEKFYISAYAAGAGVVVSGYYVCRQIYIGG